MKSSNLLMQSHIIYQHINLLEVDEKQQRNIFVTQLIENYSDVIDDNFIRFIDKHAIKNE